ncbi:Gfo/Idh/MocA family protein [Candidatus Mycoplasma pogonae]
MKNTKKYNVAVIGLGQIAYGIDDDPKRKIIWSHIRAYEKNPQTQVYALADSNLELLTSVSQKVGISSENSYTNYRAMLKDSKIEIVSICTPINTHLKIIKQCLKHENIKVIFCEKTLDFSYSKAQKIVAKCKAKGVLLVVNHSLRWDHKIIQTKEVIDHHLLGNVLSIIALGNTALFTSSSHVIDLLSYFLGTAKLVMGYEQTNFVREVHGVKDPGGLALIEFTNGVSFLKSTSKDDRHLIFEIIIDFEEGRIRIYDNFLKISFYSFVKNLSNQYMELRRDLGKYIKLNERTLAIIQDIVHYLNTGENKIKSTGETSLEAIKIINAIIKSAQQKRIIKLK